MLQFPLISLIAANNRILDVGTLKIAVEEYIVVVFVALRCGITHSRIRECAKIELCQCRIVLNFKVQLF